MHLELQPHEIRQDGGGSGLGFDGGCALAGLWADDGESICWRSVCDDGGRVFGLWRVDGGRGWVGRGMRKGVSLNGVESGRK